MNLFTVVAGLVSINAAILVWCLILTVRQYRRLKHIQVLDNLLALLCYQSFLMSQSPVWLAWANVMGQFRVEVYQDRLVPRDDP